MKFAITLFLILTLFQFSCKSENQELESASNQMKILNPAVDERPNILWLVVEDQSPNIAAFGDSTVVTPTLDKLAASGVCYDNFFAPHPVCAPARASMITGMYANHISASHMRTGPWFSDNISEAELKRVAHWWPDGIKPYEAVPEPHIKMFTEYLRAAGYYCTNNAKQDYQFKKTMTAWDESSKNAHWRNGTEGKPFFSIFNFEVTHESKIWTKSNDSLWVDENIDVPVPPYLPNTDVGRKDVRRMYSNILEMDSQVGKIIAQLKEDGLLENTIIFWFSDHGGPLPRQKRLLHDSGLKVPLIVRFPKKEFGGMRDDRIINFIDLAPTMLSLAGIAPKEYMDGKAFLGPYMRNKEPKYTYGAADRFDAKYDRNRTIRDKRFRYIRYYMPEKPMYLDVAYREQMPIMQELIKLRDSGKLDEAQSLWFRDKKPMEELFDLENDPHEINDLAKNPKYSEKLKELSEALDRWLNENEDTGMIDEKELVQNLWPNGIQPITDAPSIIKQNDSLLITCNTPGASIGYKIVDKKHQISDIDSWRVYTGPIVMNEGSKVVAIAHRLGFKRSVAVEFIN